jgi:hypothetical protein
VAKAGEIRIENVAAPEARQLELRVSISTPSQTYTNRWNLWTFPRQRLLRKSAMPVFSLVKSRNLSTYFPFVQPLEPKDESAKGVLITSELSLQAMEWLKKGNRVLVLADKIQADQQASVGTYLPAAFGGALGIKIREHPALRGFPHDGFPDLQFFNLFEGGSQFLLAGTDWQNVDCPRESYAPIIDGINVTEGKSDTISYFGLLFETKVGEGKLLFSTLNIQQHLDEAYPEVLYLLGCLLRYVTSPEFNPAGEISEGLLSRLMVPVSYRIHS